MNEDLVDKWDRFEAAKNKAMNTLLFADGVAAREAFRAINEGCTFSRSVSQGMAVARHDLRHIGGNVVSFAEASAMRLEQRWEIFVASLIKAEESRAQIDSHIAGTALYAFLTRPDTSSNTSGDIINFPHGRSMT